MTFGDDDVEPLPLSLGATPLLFSLRRFFEQPLPIIGGLLVVLVVVGVCSDDFFGGFLSGDGNRLRAARCCCYLTQKKSIQ